ncbi:GNAT family protein [Myroides odoratimimus]|uniref:GNAT family N-acetyltransferase n=1 Tax=Myroides odoratimimus TaxID=76832 RepID=UPI001CE13B27|nr:GNAT family protein [Myroides odoratimimus]MCA4793224.1 GNAT family N-acetyltransferase [Myroides odoratimimus]MCA4820374.1 GNAT family N-acetyltransferase [Myroides odoratimimus]MDM1459508.1 GNAT family N-acetyltransferase [Myroides odoratimimus]MDM1521317.1 GNAT family N-acetyltransferase [Myroides odoratimimus]MEC4051639.1 GNAT family protein [Myroides odoratimimus]
MREFIFDHIETSRFKLRILEAEAYQNFLRLATAEELLHYIGIPEEEVEQEKVKAAYGFRTYNKSYLMFLIIDKETEDILGYCGYHTWYLEHDRAEIGYGLYHDNSKGRGVMSEVLNTVLHYGFETMQLRRVEAFISPDNMASLNTVKKFGFTREGQFRSHYVKGEKIEDSVVFSLLRGEYNKLK